MDPVPNPSGRDRGAEDAIFAESTDLPPAEREQFVRTRCAGDEGLVQSVLALLAQFDRLGSFLNRPINPVPQPEPQIGEGTILANRFRINRRIGQGGMGVVFCADDLELGETVALKMVREIWVDDPAMLVRFRNEIRLARKIAHPAICRIYDLFMHALAGRDCAFFTMEYLEGRNFADLLAGGWRPDAPEILENVRNIAAGLDAAHDAGIVHRDLKPANIVLAAGEHRATRPVITDFGLAQALADQGGALTRAGQIAGSPDYMAPEQFLGEPVTAATDVFSLAVIVYEMATGRTPWPPHESIVRAALRRVGGAPVELNCGLRMPTHWNAILETAMARDPSLRPKRAGDLLRGLEGLGPSRRRVTRRALSFGRALPSRRTFLVASGAAAVMSGLYAFYRYKERNIRARPEPILAITPVTAYDGNKGSLPIDFLMQTQLRQSAHVSILDPAALAAVWKKMQGRGAVPFPARLTEEEARRIALFAGAQYVLFVSTSRTGDDYGLHVKIEGLGSRPETPDAVRTWHLAASNERVLIGATREASRLIRDALGEIPSEIAARAFAPDLLATGNWEALQEFVQAEQDWIEEIHGRRADEAIRRLKRALELDPEFALAAGRLGDLKVATGQEEEGLRYEQRAIDLLDRRDLTERQSLRIRGIFYQDTGQDEKAENLFSLWAIAYPKDGLPLFYKSKSLIRMGRAEEGYALRGRALRLEPDNVAFRFGVAEALLAAGDLAGAERAVAQIAPNGITDRISGAIAFGRGRLSEVWQCIERMRSRNSDPFRCESFSLGACLLAETGDWNGAEREIRNGIQLALDRGLNSSILAGKIILARIQAETEKMAAAGVTCRELLDLRPGLRRTMEIGCILARTGATGLAKSCMAPAPDPRDADSAYLGTPVYSHWRQRLSAWIALAEKRPEAAVAALKGVPPPELLDDWPRYLPEADIAARRYESAAMQIAALFHNPGRYWRLADTTGPGFFRWSVSMAEKYRLADRTSPEFINLKTFLAA